MLKINNYNKIIVGNWKLNGSSAFLEEFMADFTNTKLNSNTCAVICPPVIYLNQINSILHPFHIGSQDCSNYDEGAFTGEISALMLKEDNCQFCLVGHSERRQIFGQTNADVIIKTENLIKNKINPIICVGETIDEKKAGNTELVLYEQISKGLPKTASVDNLIIAYEPVWAIGTGLTPSLDDINNIHYFLKKKIRNCENYKIIYGGSVKPDNVGEIMDLEHVDGVLVGGSSLNSKDFKKILQA